MKTTIADSIVPFKVKDLVGMVMSRKQMDFESAVYYVYFSKLYSDLNDDHLKLWYQSSEALYSMLESEKIMHRASLTGNSKELMFCIFCIQNFIKYKMPGQKEKVLDAFSRTGVYSFLIRNFEMLHSQDVQYIMDSIDMYLKNRR